MTAYGVFLAYNAIAHHKIVVPPIDPFPHPTPVSGRLHAIYAIDVDSGSTDAAAQLAKEGIKEKLQALDCAWHVMPKGGDDYQKYNLGPHVEKAGGLPCLLIQVKGKAEPVVVKAKPTIDEILKLVKQVRDGGKL